MKNKTGGTKYMSVIVTVALLVIIFAAIATVYFVSKQTTLQEKQTDTTEKQAEAAATDNLAGKPATISTYSNDRANVNSVTHAASALYLILNPVVTADSITGTFAADGTLLSSSSRTDITNGISMGLKFVAISSNSTYFGFPTKELTVGVAEPGILTEGQSANLDVDTYRTTNSLKITMKEASTDTETLTNGGSTKNLTVAANEVVVLNYLEIQQNQSNRAFNLAGFYIDKTSNGNISEIGKASDYSTGSGNSNPPFDVSATDIMSTEADDVRFALTTPILMKEYGKVTFTDAIKLTGDSDGCASANSGESYVLYVFDKIWYKSSVTSDKMIYAVETDSSSHTDIGMTNPSFTILCAAA